MSEEYVGLPKYHKWSSILLSLLFCFLLSISGFAYSEINKLIGFYIFFSLVATGYLYVLAGSLHKKFIWSTIKVLVLSFSFIALVGLLPSVFLQDLFILLCFPVFAYFIFTLFGSSEEIVRTQFLIISLSFNISFTGWLLYYFERPLILVLSILFVLYFIIIRSSLSFTPFNNTEKFFHAITVSLFGSQIFWALSFLPFHYSVIGLFAALALYFVWSIDFVYVYGVFSKKKLIWEVSLLSVLILFTFIFTRIRVL